MAAAYKALDSVQYDGMYFRRDIAYQYVDGGVHQGLEPWELTARRIQSCRALGHSKTNKGATYDQAGVSIDAGVLEQELDALQQTNAQALALLLLAGNKLVDLIKPLTRATRRAGCDGELGGFGALFDVKAAGYEDPIIVSATDGVGTKLRIAQLVGIHNTIGLLRWGVARSAQAQPPTRIAHQCRSGSRGHVRQRSDRARRRTALLPRLLCVRQAGHSCRCRRR